MQDFRPRLSSTYQPRQSLSHLVSKFESLDNRPQRPSYAPVPRRVKTLPTVPPGQWLSSTGSSLSEKQPMEEQPELASTPTLGQRHKSVAERRKLFENTNALPSDRISDTRVFSRDVGRGSSLPTEGQVSLQGALETIENGANMHPTEAIRQVRRMPRLDVARSRPLPSNEPEWPLKSDSPLRTSFESYDATKTSIEWKPTPARERSLSRRGREVKATPIQSNPCDMNSTRDSSAGSITLESAVDQVPSLGEEEETSATAISDKNPRSSAILDRATPAKNFEGPVLDVVTRLTIGTPEPEAVATSIGYPSVQTTSTASAKALPASQSHGVLLLMKNSSSWAAKQSNSPLKDKIGMFESLSRQDIAVESREPLGSVGSQPPTLPHPRRNVSKHAASLSRGANRIRATLRKIPVSWERGHVKHTLSAWKENADGWGDHQETASSRTAGCARHRATLNAEKREPISKINIGRFFSPAQSLSGNAARSAPTPYNPFRRGVSHKASSAGTGSDSMGVLGTFGSDKTTSTRSAPVAATRPPHFDAKVVGTPPERSNSRSSGSPMFARVQCRLDQPMPVRGDELKRLVSLCKNSALRRSSRAQTG